MIGFEIDEPDFNVGIPSKNATDALGHVEGFAAGVIAVTAERAGLGGSCEVRSGTTCSDVVAIPDRSKPSWFDNRAYRSWLEAARIEAGFGDPRLVSRSALPFGEAPLDIPAGAIGKASGLLDGKGGRASRTEISRSSNVSPESSTTATGASSSSLRSTKAWLAGRLVRGLTGR